MTSKQLLTHSHIQLVSVHPSTNSCSWSHSHQGSHTTCCRPLTTDFHCNGLTTRLWPWYLGRHLLSRLLNNLDRVDWRLLLQSANRRSPSPIGRCWHQDGGRAYFSWTESHCSCPVCPQLEDQLEVEGFGWEMKRKQGQKRCLQRKIVDSKRTSYSTNTNNKFKMMIQLTKQMPCCSRICRKLTVGVMTQGNLSVMWSTDTIVLSWMNETTFLLPISSIVYKTSWRTSSSFTSPLDPQSITLCRIMKGVKTTIPATNLPSWVQESNARCTYLAWEMLDERLL